MTDRCWVPHPTEVWGVAVAEPTSGVYKLTEVTDEATDPQKVEFSVTAAQQAQVAAISDPRSLEGVDNVCDLADVSEAAILHTVRVRYKKEKIYTNVGRIVLATNPFKYLPLYGQEYVQQYFKAAHAFDLPPHLFQVSAAALKGLSEKGKPQSTLITGESGAGKTESTKLILQFLADVSETSSSSSSYDIAASGRISSSRQQQNPHFGKNRTGLSSSRAAGGSTLKAPGTTNRLGSHGGATAAGGGGGTGGGSLQQRILEISPVLESFGNASTSRNANSSRFGKWIEVYFGDSLKVLGASMTSYLLELPRVTRHVKGERNYHVFYQLVHGVASSSGLVGVASSYRLGTDPLAFSFLVPQAYATPSTSGASIKKGAKGAGGGDSTAASGSDPPKTHDVDDLGGFNELKRALLVLGFDPSTQNDIFSIVASLLHLGNVTFTPEGGGEKSAVASNTREHLATASELLGLSIEMVEGALTTRKIKTGNENIVIPLKPDQALAARDAFAKLIYGYLFTWLIEQINASLAPTQQQFDGSRYVGLLDIAGFESFQVNGFEQLCINLSNEELQHHFNEDIFLNEASDYEKDGLKGLSISYQDNADVLKLIAGKGGILATLDEEVFVPKGSEQGFLNKLNKAQGGNARYIQNKVQGSMSFGIHHYAGDVTYTVDGWLAKDQNAPPQEAVDCLYTSKNAVVNALVSNVVEGGGSSKGSKSTVGSVFKRQLNELMTKINGTDSHYIRCIKPNKKHQPKLINSDQILSQLVCSGVMEAIRIRKAGFALRMPHKEFVDRYRLVIGTRKASSCLKGLDPTSAAQALVNELVSSEKVNSEECLVGKTKVFAKSTVQDFLEHAREAALVEPVILIQAVYRGWRTRQQCKVLFEVYGQLKVFLQAGEEATKRGGYLTSEPVFPDAANPALLQRKAILLGDLISKLESLDPSLQPGCLATVAKYHVKMTAEASISLELERLLKETEGGSRGEMIDREAPGALRAALQKAENKKLSGPLITQAADRIRQLDEETALGDSIDEALRQKDRAGLESLLAQASRLKAGNSRFITSYLPPLIASAEAFLADDARESQRLAEERQAAEKARREAKEREQQEALLLDAVEERKRSERLSVVSVVSGLAHARSKREAARKSMRNEEKRGGVMTTAGSSFDEESSTSESDWTDSSEDESVYGGGMSGSGDEEEEGGEALFSSYLSKFVREVARATRECDAVQLEFFLQRAQDAKLSRMPRELHIAKQQLENLRDPPWLTSELKEAVVAVTWGANTEEDMTKLRNLVRQAQEVRKHYAGFESNVDPDVLKAAVATLENLRGPLDGGIGGVGRGEGGGAGGAQKGFQFENFPLLKINQQIQETKGSKKLERLLLRREELLSHQTDPLTEPLLDLPDSRCIVMSLNCFRSLLGVMGDRFCVGKSALSEEILQLGRQAEDLRDEIYCQLLKQLRNNPSPSGVLAGLRLLQAACQSFPPSGNLEPYLRYFLQQTSVNINITVSGTGGGVASIQHQQEVEEICRQALRDLDVTCRRSAGGGGGRKKKDEDGSSGGAEGDDRQNEADDDEATEVQVRLTDGSRRRLFLEGDLPQDLSSRLVKDLNLVGGDDWAIMEEVPEYILKSASTKDTSPTAYRLLPSKQTVQSYIGTARGTHAQLCLRRPMLSVDEPLSLHPATASLIYRQALQQYQQHVVREDLGLLAAISARILQVEGVYKKTSLATTPWRSISWSVPQRLIWLQSEKDWLRSIACAAEELDPDDGDLLAMNATFALMQKLSIFGGYVILSDAFPLYSSDLSSNKKISTSLEKILPSDISSSYDDLIDNSNVPGYSSSTQKGGSMKQAHQRSKRSLLPGKGNPSNAASSSPRQTGGTSRQQHHHRGFLQKLFCRKIETSSGGSGSSSSSASSANPYDGNRAHGGRGVGGFKGQLWICIDRRGLHFASVFDSEGLCTGAGFTVGGLGEGGRGSSLGEKETDDGTDGGGDGKNSSHVGRSRRQNDERDGDEEIDFSGGGDAGEEGEGVSQQESRRKRNDMDNGSGILDEENEEEEQEPEEEMTGEGDGGVEGTKKRTMKSKGDGRREQRGEVVTIPPEKLWYVAALPADEETPDRIVIGFEDPRSKRRRLSCFVTQIPAEDVLRLILLFFPFCSSTVSDDDDAG